MVINSNYFRGEGVDFNDQLSSIFNQNIDSGVTVRLVFFGNVKTDREYLEHLELISNAVNNYYKNRPPVFSYVAQPPLDGSLLAMESTFIESEGIQDVSYRSINGLNYIVAGTTMGKWVFLGGVRADSVESGIREQADSIFKKIGGVLTAEDMPVSSIVRQWNYIEHIVKTSEGHQNYQDFNESRTVFYNSTKWEKGYPAATGVGTECAGVMVELDAFSSKNSERDIFPINNSLQVPAHAYSPSVLIGEEEKTGPKTTPKFERGKVVANESGKHIYISGTAAIRGEMSLDGVGVEEQTNITLENIEYLISGDNLSAAGVKDAKDGKFSSMRVYLKDESFLEPARKIINQKYSHIPSLYIKADVCRAELLVEIEGFAFTGR